MADDLDVLFHKSLRTFLKPLVPLWDDPSISAVYVNGPQQIWVDRDGRHELTETAFSPQMLEQAVKQIAQLLGANLHAEQPFARISLDDGSQISIVVPPLSSPHTILTLQKAQQQYLSLDDCIAEGRLDYHTASFLKACLQAHQTVLVVGASASQPQQLAASLAAMIPEDERLLRLSKAKRPLPFDHPHGLSIAWPQPPSNRQAEFHYASFFQTLTSLGTQRLWLEELNAERTLPCLQLIQHSHPGSILSLQASGAWHALRQLEAMALAQAASITSLRALIASSVQLILVCHVRGNGRPALAEILEVMPLDHQGQWVLRTLFSALKRPVEEGVCLVPVGHVPRFLPQLQWLGLSQFDEGFFSAENDTSLLSGSGSFDTLAAVSDAEQERVTAIDFQAKESVREVLAIERLVSLLQNAIQRPPPGVAPTLPNRKPMAEASKSGAEQSLAQELGLRGKPETPPPSLAKPPVASPVSRRAAPEVAKPQASKQGLAKPQAVQPQPPKPQPALPQATNNKVESAVPRVVSGPAKPAIPFVTAGPSQSGIPVREVVSQTGVKTAKSVKAVTEEPSWDDPFIDTMKQEQEAAWSPQSSDIQSVPKAEEDASLMLDVADILTEDEYQALQEQRQAAAVSAQDTKAVEPGVVQQQRPLPVQDSAIEGVWDVVPDPSMLSPESESNIPTKIGEGFAAQEQPTQARRPLVQRGQNSSAVRRSPAPSGAGRSTAATMGGQELATRSVVPPSSRQGQSGQTRSPAMELESMIDTAKIAESPFREKERKSVVVRKGLRHSSSDELPMLGLDETEATSVRRKPAAPPAATVSPSHQQSAYPFARSQPPQQPPPVVVRQNSSASARAVKPEHDPFGQSRDESTLIRGRHKK